MKTCVDCEKRLCATNRSGRCKSCFTIKMNSDPDFQRRRVERIRIKMADPIHREKMAATIRNNSAKWRASPEGAAWMEQNGRRLATEILQRPETRARANSKEAKTRAIATKRGRAFGWFPPERTDELVFLMRRKKLTGKEAAAMLRAEAEAERVRAEAALSPFDRQMRALERGGKVVANDARPSGNQVVRRFG